MVHELPQTICLVLSKRKLADVALYSPACSCCCRNKRPTPDYYCGNVLESRGIGVGSSPIGCEGFVKASKVQGSSLLLSNANNFVRYSYVARDFFPFSTCQPTWTIQATPRILAAFPSGAWAAIEKLGTGNASGHNAGQAAHVRTSGHTFLVPGTALHFALIVLHAI